MSTSSFKCRSKYCKIRTVDIMSKPIWSLRNILSICILFESYFCDFLNHHLSHSSKTKATAATGLKASTASFMVGLRLCKKKAAAPQCLLYLQVWQKSAYPVCKFLNYSSANSHYQTDKQKKQAILATISNWPSFELQQQAPFSEQQTRRQSFTSSSA